MPKHGIKPWSLAYEANALSLSYVGMEPRPGIGPEFQSYQDRVLPLNYHGEKLERAEGIEPSSSAWKATALPLS